jgi:hypothetical protein
MIHCKNSFKYYDTPSVQQYYDNKKDNESTTLQKFSNTEKAVLMGKVTTMNTYVKKLDSPLKIT